MKSVDTAWWLAREARKTLSALRASPAEIERLADRRLHYVLRSASSAPHFRRRLANGGLDPARLESLEPLDVLRTIEPVDKQALREAGEDALTGGRVRSEWFSSVSSGSTGEPFRTYFDARSWALLKHLVKVRSRLANGLGPTDRVAIFDAIAPDQEGTTALERLGRVRRVSVFRTGASMAERLAGFRPQAVYGLASALLEVADALDAVEPVRVPLVFTSGEVLGSGARRRLEAAFGARVLDIYGSTEMKEIAWECKAGAMHLNSDVVRVEILGNDGEELPPGAEGNVVVTSLVNVAMPMIRFRIGDRGTLSDEGCRCGVTLPRLGIVTGRVAEVLNVGGRRLSPYVFTSALEKIGGLVRYQVVQLETTRFVVRSVLARGVSPESVAGAVRGAVAAAVGTRVAVDVEFVERLGNGPGRKTRVVQPLAATPEEDDG